MNAIAKPTEFVTPFKECVIEDSFNSKFYDFSVDWLNLTIDVDDVSLVLLKICSVLGIDISEFADRESGGVCFYSKAYYIPACGYSSFTINYNVDEHGHLITIGKKGQTKGVLLSISGDGCRWISTFGETAFIELCVALNEFDCKCTRIDLACDIFDDKNFLVPMIQDFASTAYHPDFANYDLNCGLNRKDDKGNYRKWVDLHPVFDNVVGGFTTNVTVGGRDCKKGTLQLYNKRVEVETGRLSEFSDYIKTSVAKTDNGVCDYWWRLEYRCKSYAQSVFDYMVNEQNIFGTFLQACEGFGSFVVTDGRNISECSLSVEWQSFLYFVEKLMGAKLFISYNSKSIVNSTYFLCELDKIERYHKECIPSSDSAHWFRMCIDDVYRQHFINKYCQELLFNPKMKKFKDEMRVRYGLKMDEFLYHVWGQMSIFD